MYLSSFRKHGVGPGNWSAIPCAKDNPEMDRLLDLADDTLNSWKEAHNVFNTWQQNQTRVDGMAFSLMKTLVHRVIGPTICNTMHSEGNEAITYALLVRWIDNRQAGLKAGEVFE